MKKHLINLLLEQFKQDYLIAQLDELGIEMQVAAVELTPIVYDLVGLPSDNTEEYFHAYQHGTLALFDKKPFDNHYCSRHWLAEKYKECISSQLKKVKLHAVSRGLTFAHKKEEEEVRKILSTFVDWLYEQEELIRYAKQDDDGERVF